MLVAGRCDRVNFAKENKMCGDGVNGRDAAAKHCDGPLQHGHTIGIHRPLSGFETRVAAQTCTA